MTLPTGTVTFLFTDIEASTRHLARDPDAYPALVAAQRALVGAAAEACGGTMFGHEGDASFVVFADASAAVAAAGRAQLALLDHPWAEGHPVRVRIGLHTGTADVADGDYYGLAVHTVARVAAAAHGGQVVLTEATRRAGLPPGWGTQDLGVHRLRDIDDPVLIHQLDGHGLPTGFPALRTTPAGPALPTPASSLIGREAETAAVRDRLRHQRIVTLLGPGGIGKTRLALHVGADVAAQCPDGVWFADLTSVERASDVADVVADAVGVSVGGGVDAVSAIADTVADRRALLIVDNFEHVVAAAPTVSALVDRTAHLRVLITSRERLRLAGEWVYDVEPLGVAEDGDADRGDAVRLFLDRARAVRADLDTSPRQLAAVAEICARLDGLPLAIELAAARCRLLQPTEIAERLRARPLQLARGSRDAHGRQQTIRRTIEWSHHLLTADEQDVFARLAVFATPARLDAIDEVVGGVSDADVDDALAGLVDKSLVQLRRGPEGGTRARMLQVVGEFATEQLAALPDVDDLRDRHAAHYAAWTERVAAGMLRSEPDRWVRRVDDERSDVERAFAWAVERRPVDAVRICAALGMYFHRTGEVAVAQRWTAQVRDVDVPPDVDVRRAIAIGFARFGLLDLAGARAAVEHALRQARATGDRVYETYAILAIAHTWLGEPDAYDEALALARRGTALAREIGTPVLAGIGWNIEGELARVHGDDVAADAAYRAAIGLARETGDHQRDGVCHGNRVYIATRRGALDEAVDLARHAVAVHRRFGHRNHLAWVAIALAGALVRMDRVSDAATLVGAAEAMAARLGLREVAGDVGENDRIRALIRERAGSDAAAWDAFGRSLPLDDVLDQVLFAGERPDAVAAGETAGRTD